MTFSIKTDSIYSLSPRESDVNAVIDMCASYFERVEGAARGNIKVKSTLEYRDGTPIYDTDEKTLTFTGSGNYFGGGFNFKAADKVSVRLTAGDEVLDISYNKGEGRITIDVDDKKISERLKQYITRNGYPETVRSYVGNIVKAKNTTFSVKDRLNSFISYPLGEVDEQEARELVEYAVNFFAENEGVDRNDIEAHLKYERANGTVAYENTQKDPNFSLRNNLLFPTDYVPRYDNQADTKSFKKTNRVTCTIKTPEKAPVKITYQRGEGRFMFESNDDVLLSKLKKHITGQICDTFGHTEYPQTLRSSTMSAVRKVRSLLP